MAVKEAERYAFRYVEVALFAGSPYQHRWVVTGVAITPAISSAVTAIKNRPVVFTFTYTPLEAGAGTSFTDHLPFITGVGSFPPVERTVAFIRDVFPRATRVGTLYISSDTNSRKVVEMAKKDMAEKGLTLVENTVVNTNEVYQAVSAICQRQIDVLWITGENTMMQAFDAVVKASMPGIRVIGTVYTPSEINSVFYMEALRKEAEKVGLTLLVAPASTVTEVSDAAARLLLAGEHHYALGLGAIGDRFETCKDRMGEFLLMDGQVAYLPADGSKRPDYMVNSGHLIASLTALYGVSCTGDFSALVRFTGEKGDGALEGKKAAGGSNTTFSAESLGVGPMLKGLYQLLGYEDFLMISIAEISGLVGVSLNQSPVGHPDLFAFPGVKEMVNFTTEPECEGMLGVTLGIYSRRPDEGLTRFLRPVSLGADAAVHLHTAVFPYMPLKKTGIDLHETMHTLLII